MYTEDAFFGMPLEVNNLCFVYPPKIKDIIQLGYEVFNIYSSFLTRSQEDIEDEITKDKTHQIKPEEIPNPFIFLLTIMSLSKEIEATVKKAFQFFIHDEVTPLYDLQTIVLGPIKEKRFLTADNFFDFQNAVRAAIGIKMIEKPDPNEHPRVRYFKAKQRARDRAKAKQNNLKITKLSTLITSICCMNMGVNPTNVQELTFASINALIDRYNEKDSFETHIAVQLASGSNKEKPYWIRDL